MLMMSKRKSVQNFQSGDVVWACIDKKYWPAIIINHNDAGVELAKSGHQWVFWFQDHRISQVIETQICSFKSNFKKYVKKSVRGAWKIAILEGIRSIESDEIINIEEDQLIDWALSRYSKNDDISIRQIPKSILKILRDMKIKNGIPLFRSLTNELQKDLINNIKNGVRKLDDICLGCYDVLCEEYLEHPYFEGVLCDECHERIKSTILVFDVNVDCRYCNVCGYNGKTMTKCANNLCNRIYCDVCLNDFFAETENEENFVCACKSKDSNSSILRLRENNKFHVYNLFADENADIPKLNDTTSQKGLVVLSLFDGISTGFYVLNSLNIPVEKYYASEINLTAIELGNRNYNKMINYLGDVKNINSVKLNEIGSIDLLLGGSPCNELSLANPYRKGLYHGTGRLFFEYFRIYKLLKLNNKGKKFFWLYENVASMTEKTKKTIDSYLNVEGILIDSKLFSPQIRKRFYWGNLPTLKQNYVDCGTKLQDCLDDGRKALTEKLNTITTQSNSLKGSSSTYPVHNGSNMCCLKINELERIFGFSDNYTYLPNLSKTERQKLLGNSWSAQTIKMFLSFLLMFYEK